MFDWNYNNVKRNLQEMEKEILELDTRYSTTNRFLNSIRVVNDNIEELVKRRNTGVRTKGKWEEKEDGQCYCSDCGAPKIQVYNNFCAHCGADMGEL